MCIPYATNNALVYFITQTSPLCDYLKCIHLKRFLTLRFPEYFENVTFSMPEECNDISSSASEVPEYFSSDETIFELPLNSSMKRARMYDQLDIVHFSICENKSFHTSSEVGGSSCVCKFCNHTASHFHHRSCPFLGPLPLMNMMKKVGVICSSVQS